MNLDEVLIVIITKDSVSPECLNSVFTQGYDWMISGRHPRHVHDSAMLQTYLNCAENRDIARQMALAHPLAKWFLFVDSDIVLPIGAVHEFLRQTVVEHAEQRVLGGWYKIRNTPHWCAGNWVADNVFLHRLAVVPSISLTELVGLGCTFMSRKAATDLQFKPGIDTFAKDRMGNEITLGECATFSNDAMDKGYSLFMDGSVVCGHPD